MEVLRLMFIILLGLCLFEKNINCVTSEKNEKEDEIYRPHIWSLVNYLNSNSGRVYNYNYATLISAQNKDSDNTHLLIDVEVECRNPDSNLCITSVVTCEGIVKYNAETAKYDVSAGASCHPKLRLDLASSPAEEVQVRHTHLDAESPSNSELELTHEVSEGNISGEQFIAVRSNSSVCVGCPFDINTNVEGIDHLTNLALKHIESERDCKQVLLRILRVQQQVVSGVKYIVLLEVASTTCPKYIEGTLASPTTCLIDTNTIPEICEIVYFQQPWISKDKHIISNNCTESQEYKIQETSIASSNLNNNTNRESSNDLNNELDVNFNYKKPVLQHKNDGSEYNTEMEDNSPNYDSIAESGHADDMLINHNGGGIMSPDVMKEMETQIMYKEQTSTTERTSVLTDEQKSALDDFLGIMGDQPRHKRSIRNKIIINNGDDSSSSSSSSSSEEETKKNDADSSSSSSDDDNNHKTDKSRHNDNNDVESSSSSSSSSDDDKKDSNGQEETKKNDADSSSSSSSSSDDDNNDKTDKSRHNDNNDVESSSSSSSSSDDDKKDSNGQEETKKNDADSSSSSSDDDNNDKTEKSRHNDNNDVESSSSSSSSSDDDKKDSNGHNSKHDNNGDNNVDSSDDDKNSKDHNSKHNNNKNDSSSSSSEEENKGKTTKIRKSGHHDKHDNNVNDDSSSSSLSSSSNDNDKIRKHNRHRRDIINSQEVQNENKLDNKDKDNSSSSSEENRTGKEVRAKREIKALDNTSSESDEASEERNRQAAAEQPTSNPVLVVQIPTDASSQEDSSEEFRGGVRRRRYALDDFAKVTPEDKDVIQNLGNFAVSTLDDIDADNHKRIVLQLLGAKKMSNDDGILYQLILRVGISHCSEDKNMQQISLQQKEIKDDDDDCRSKLFENLTKICKMQVQVSEEKINPKIVKSYCQNIKRENENSESNRTRFRRKRQGVPGGISSVSTEDENIKMYARDLLTELDREDKSGKRHELVKVLSATRQVVSGLLYKLKLNVTVELESRICDYEVWEQPWLQPAKQVRVTCKDDPAERRYRYRRSLQDSLDQDDIYYAYSFKLFRDLHAKTYNTEAEFNKRFQIYKENLQKIEELNANEQGTAHYGHTFFADFTLKEYKRYLGLKPELHNPNNIPYPPGIIPNIEQLPQEFDWRQKGAVSEVKNQGMCGSCWAFSVTGNIEGLNAIKASKMVELSEQELVDCDTLDNGCEGGLPDNAYRAIEKLGGLESERDYPYDAKDEKCHFNKSLSRVQISGAVNISSNETDMAKWLIKNGPISIGINANAMQFYMGGISHPWKVLCNPKELDHGVLIVGYGVHKYPRFHKVLPYWIVKNSWGSRWGEQGYYRVYRGDGTCGLNLMASSAVL